MLQTNHAFSPLKGQPRRDSADFGEGSSEEGSPRQGRAEAGDARLCPHADRGVRQVPRGQLPQRVVPLQLLYAAHGHDECGFEGIFGEGYGILLLIERGSKI